MMAPLPMLQFAFEFVLAPELTPELAPPELSPDWPPLPPPHCTVFWLPSPPPLCPPLPLPPLFCRGTPGFNSKVYHSAAGTTALLCNVS